ncbi:ISL3 family transposase [Amycolatopsis eburnea]|uniref:ISL3 family transposase n=1 Tax=Amycolatopsis eburnea TaxID=2267691 RepID=A0A427T7L4_9PSEU|nr:ISL3 family transposase [Amycolatopsis eburnea]RSD16346.1 ISL3 family transposase [Amycolatopsis eburnea]
MIDIVVAVCSTSPQLAGILLLDLPNVVLTDLRAEGGELRGVIHVEASGAQCPACGTWSARVHGNYTRSVNDLPTVGRRTILTVRVRRFVCEAKQCPRRTFAEQVPGLTRRHSRWSERLRSTVATIGLALAGRAGARLCAALGIKSCRSTVLRRVGELPDPAPSDPRVVGVDEYAQRKGHVYGTVLVDVETHRPVDLLPNREASTVAEWLSERPGIEVVCRDRATFYAEAATVGAPQAVQVADRWHLWHNLTQTVERCVSRHSACIRAALSTTDVPAPSGSDADSSNDQEQVSPWPTGHRFADRVRATHAAVHELLAAGHSQRAIARHLGMGGKTVARYARAATPEALFSGQWQNRPSKLDPFKAHLRQRWADGATNAWALWKEIGALGYAGGYGAVRDHLRTMRTVPQAVALKPPSPRRVSGWITTRPEMLPEPHRRRLQAILAHCPELTALVEHVGTFADMLTTLQGERLGQWLVDVRGDDLPSLHNFAAGLERDLAAVTAGLTLPWNSGVVEGHVNRIKMLKRQMYGRAGFHLLRKRVLLA